MSGTDPIAAVARVLHADGSTAGTGFLVTGTGLVVTCAHVVVAAGAGPGGRVRLAFQFVDAPPADATVLSDGWQHPAGVDVAFLQLTGLENGSKIGATPPPLRSATESAGNRFLAYGYPPVMGASGMFGYGLVGNVVRKPGAPDLLQLTQTTEVTPGFSGGPVIDQVTGGVIGMITSIAAQDALGRLAQTAFATPAEVLADLHPALRTETVCPYRSLDVFEVEHARFFFGREAVVADLIARLRSQRRFLAILGPSGSGKSSLLRAGLLHELQEGALPGSASWRFEPCRPSDHHHLLEVLTSLATLPEGVAVEPRGRTVVAIDQFEEVFALEESVRDRIREALSAVLTGGGSVSVVLTMRDDFYSRLARDLPELLNDWVLRGAINVPAVLDEETVREIVIGPAHAVGLQVSDDLVQAILADLPREREGGVSSSLLPVIESALTQLWREREDERLTAADLRRLGGVSGSLASWADDAYFAMPPAQQSIARRIVTRLVHLGDDRLGLPEARQVVLLGDLRDELQGGPVDDVLSRLVTSRLVVARRDDSTGAVAVELIHDALLREWTLLREWLERDRAFLAWRQWLDYRMASWREVDQADVGSTQEASNEDLLRGRELTQASEWLVDRGDELGPRQRAFIAASQEEERRRRQELEAAAAERQRAAVLEVTQRLTVQAADVDRILPVAPSRALAAALTVTAANVRELGGEPLAQVQNALHLAVRTAGERLVLTGEESWVTCCAVSPSGDMLATGGDDRMVRFWTVDGSSAGLLACEDAVTCITYSPAAEPVVVMGTASGAVRACTSQGRPLRWPVADHADRVTGLAVSRDGGVASASSDGTVRLRDGRGEPIGPPLLAHEAGVGALALSADGSMLATAGLDGQIRLWDLRRLQADAATALRELPPLDLVVPVVAFHPDGSLLAFGDEAGEVHVHHVDDLRSVLGAPWPGHGDLVTGLLFSPDGSLLVSGALDSQLLVREVRGGTSVRSPVPAPAGPVVGLAKDDDARLVLGACGAAAIVWDWLPPPVDSLSRSGTSLAGRGADGASSPVTGTEDSTAVDDENLRSRTGYRISLWDRAGDQQTQAWTGHSDTVYGLAVTVDGLIASGGGDRAVLVRDSTGTVLNSARGAHQASITAVAASAAKPEFATAGRDGAVRLWSTRCERLGELRGHDGDLMAVAFSADGELLLTGSRDRTAALWRLDGSSQPVQRLLGHSDDVVAVAFHPSGKFLVTGSRDATVRVWAPDGSAVAPALCGHVGFVGAVDVCPAGDVLASGGADGTVRLWSPEGVPASLPFVAHSGPVRAVRFADAGRLLVTAGDDGTVGVWDRSGGAVCEPLRGHEGPVWSLAVTPDSAFVVTGGADTTVRLWRLGTWRSWLREGCERLRHHPVLASASSPASAAAAAACASRLGAGPLPGADGGT